MTATVSNPPTRLGYLYISDEKSAGVRAFDNSAPDDCWRYHLVQQMSSRQSQA